jgi:unsaturated rhamnogalacturonyl hydrolase
MANSVMKQHDSLIYYEGKEKIRWQYDVAMLAMAIDKLGVIDQKYSNYMKTYVDYFVNEDGSIKGYKPEEYNIDRINPAKNLFTLYKRTGEEKYNQAIQLFIKQWKIIPKRKAVDIGTRRFIPGRCGSTNLYGFTVSCTICPRIQPTSVVRCCDTSNHPNPQKNP